VFNSETDRNVNGHRSSGTSLDVTSGWQARLYRNEAVTLGVGVDGPSFPSVAMPYTDRSIYSPCRPHSSSFLSVPDVAIVGLSRRSLDVEHTGDRLLHPSLMASMISCHASLYGTAYVVSQFGRRSTFIYHLHDSNNVRVSKREEQVRCVQAPLKLGHG